MNHFADFLDVHGNTVRVDRQRWIVATSAGIRRLSWTGIDGAGEPLSALCREYVQHDLLTKSPIEAYNSHKELVGFTRFCIENPHPSIQASALAYLGHLTSKGQRWRWTRIRTFCRLFAERRHPSFDHGPLDELNRVIVGGNPKGEAVRSGDAQRGPLSREEASEWRKAILNDDDDSYRAVRQRCVAILVTVLGLRPTSIVHLMECDFIQDITIDDVPVAFALDISRAKKRTKPRKLFRRIAIHPQLAATIQQLIALNRAAYPGSTPSDERPLLYASLPQRGFGYVGLSESSEGIATILRSATARYNVISPRTQRPLNVFPQRLRRTAATALAREGYSAEQIAAFLDHDDLQNVGVYVDAARGTIAPLDAAAASTYAPYIEAFKGAPPKPSSERHRTKCISYVTENGVLHILGECGQEDTPCILHPPYSCYCCDKYEPFSDANHEALQNDLHARRDTYRVSRRPAERRMAALLDQAIFGLAHVRLLIEEMENAKQPQ